MHVSNIRAKLRSAGAGDYISTVWGIGFKPVSYTHLHTEGDVRYRGESIIHKTVAKIAKNIILVFQHPERCV